jgi:hypothetical protein
MRRRNPSGSTRTRATTASMDTAARSAVVAIGKRAGSRGRQASTPSAARNPSALSSTKGSGSKAGIGAF